MVFKVISESELAGLMISVILTVGFLAVVIATLKERKKDNRNTRFKFITKQNVLYSIAIFFVLALVEILLVEIYNSLHLQYSPLIGMGNTDGWVFAVGVIIATPIIEECIFRGFIMGTLEKKLKPHWANMIAAFLFAIMHTQHGFSTALFVTFVVGCLLGYVVQKTGSLVTSIIGHCTINTSAVIIGFFGEGIMNFLASVPWLQYILFAGLLGLLVFTIGKFKTYNEGIERSADALPLVS